MGEGQAEAWQLNVGGRHFKQDNVLSKVTESLNLAPVEPGAYRWSHHSRKKGPWTQLRADTEWTGGESLRRGRVMEGEKVIGRKTRSQGSRKSTGANMKSF